MCSMQCVVCSLECAVCSVHCSVRSVQCVVCSVQCAVCSAGLNILVGNYDNDLPTAAGSVAAGPKGNQSNRETRQLELTKFGIYIIGYFAVK